jgi:hypothetical protein
MSNNQHENHDSRTVQDKLERLEHDPLQEGEIVDYIAEDAKAWETEIYTHTDIDNLFD